VLKWLITAILLAALYHFLTGFDVHAGPDAAMVITAFAGLYGLFMLTFFTRDHN
jgi:hypothetical protein